jgi:hypothetical protein
MTKQESGCFDLALDWKLYCQSKHIELTLANDDDAELWEFYEQAAGAYLTWLRARIRKGA